MLLTFSDICETHRFMNLEVVSSSTSKLACGDNSCILVIALVYLATALFSVRLIILNLSCYSLYTSHHHSLFGVSLTCAYTVFTLFWYDLIVTRTCFSRSQEKCNIVKRSVHQILILTKEMNLHLVQPTIVATTHDEVNSATVPYLRVSIWPEKRLLVTDAESFH